MKTVEAKASRQNSRKPAVAPKPQSQAAADSELAQVPEQQAGFVLPRQCACGGGCPRCRGSSRPPPWSSSMPSSAFRDHAEESRVQQVVGRIGGSPKTVADLTHRLRRPAAGDVGAYPVEPEIRHALEPYTGHLPSDLTLRTGPAIDRALAAGHARGLARGHEVWVGGPALTSSAGGFAGVFAHEAAHVASGGSHAATPPLFGEDDTLPGSWYDAERRRREELEAAETGEGRQHTLERLSSMNETDVRREAPGIAYRAQDRGDVELAQAAAQRLLDVWLGSSDHPVSLSPFSLTGDSVDILLSRTETAFGAGQWTLGGIYLSIVMVQLVRAAQIAVLRRAPAGGTGEPGLDLAASIMLPMQRGEENDIRTRVERARALLETHSTAVMEEGDADTIAQFEAMAESVHRAEARAGPAIAEDLGTGGVVDTPDSERSGRGASPPPDLASPPPRPEPTAETPASRAEEVIVDEAHPELEGALVFVSRMGQTRYGNIVSPRYAVAGTFAGARRLANELFGRRSSVIVEDTLARDGDRRQIRYLVFALSVFLNPPSSPEIQEGNIVSIRNIEMLSHPHSMRYFFLAIVTGSWQFFPPALFSYLQNVTGSEAGVEAPALSDERRREAVFGPIDALIAAGETQEAANQLTYLGAEGFALVDTDTKIRYITTLLRAFTFEANEQTVVEVFRSVDDEAELRTILAGLNREGVLRQLRTDLEYSFTTLLTVVGGKFGAGSVTASEVLGLLHEIAILQVFPGIEMRGDGSFAFNVDLAGNLVAAVEELINTVRGLIEGIAEIVLNPEAFFRGIGQLLYLGLMMQLSRYGYPPAVVYVNDFIASVARQLGRLTHGLAVLQRNMPAGVEFVRDMQTSFQWRIIWEVLGLFVGVGEAVALFEAIRGGRAAAAMSELLSGLRGVRALEEAGTAGRVLEGAGETGRVLEGASDVGRVVESAGDAERVLEGAADAERALDAAGDAERVADTAVDIERTTEATTDAERGASVVDEGAAPPREPTGPPPREPGARPPGGSHGPLPEWQEEYIQSYLDELEERGAWPGHVSREDLEEILRAQVRGRADDDVTRVFGEWEGALDRRAVRASEESRGVPVGEGHMDVPNQDLPVTPRERRIGLPPEGAGEAAPLQRVVVGPEDIADFRARHPTLPPDVDTVAVARSNVRGLEGATLDGGSPRVLREAEMPPAAIGPVEAPTTFDPQRLHAEQDIANQFIRHVESNGISPAELEGRTLGIHISNRRGVCHVCRAGLEDPDAPWGVLLQLSERYPGLTIRITVDGPPGASPAYRALILNSGELIFRL